MQTPIGGFRDFRKGTLMKSAHYTEGSSHAEANRQVMSPSPPPASAPQPLQRLQLAGLTVRQLYCLTLYYFDGFTQEQISRQLGISQPAVSQHVSHGLEKLAAQDLWPQRQEAVERVEIIGMCIATLDQLDPDSIRGQW
jgi:DNA-binding NarL/FixJ family response regulator